MHTERVTMGWALAVLIGSAALLTVGCAQDRAARGGPIEPDQAPAGPIEVSEPDVEAAEPVTPPVAAPVALEAGPLRPILPTEPLVRNWEPVMVQPVPGLVPHRPVYYKLRRRPETLEPVLDVADEPAEPVLPVALAALDGTDWGTYAGADYAGLAQDVLGFGVDTVLIPAKVVTGQWPWVWTYSPPPPSGE